MVIALALSAAGCALFAPAPKLSPTARNAALSPLLADRQGVIFLEYSANEIIFIINALELTTLQLRPAALADISETRIIDAETGQKGFLASIKSHETRADGSISVEVMLYYNRSGGELHRILLTPNGTSYSATTESVELLL